MFVMEEQRVVTFKAPSTWENQVKAYSYSFPEEMEVRIGLTTINFYEPVIFDKLSLIFNTNKIKIAVGIITFINKNKFEL